MAKFVVKYRQRDTEEVEAIEAPSEESVKSMFTDGGTYAYLDLLSIYDFDEYIDNFEQKLEYQDGLVSFEARAQQEKRNLQVE